MLSTLNDVGLECLEIQRAFVRYCSHKLDIISHHITNLILTIYFNVC